MERIRAPKPDWLLNDIKTHKLQKNARIIGNAETFICDVIELEERVTELVDLAKSEDDPDRVTGILLLLNDEAKQRLESLSQSIRRKLEN